MARSATDTRPSEPVACPGAPPARRILVAEIGAAHGLRGEVRLRSFTQDPAAVADYGALTDEAGRSFTIETLRPAKDALIVRLAGISDRNAAEELRGRKLYVMRDRLPPPDDADTFYHADLVGLAVADRDGRALGTVTAVHNFGVGDLIEIAPPAGGAVMLPFTAAVVPVVDIAAGRVVVDPPAGAFEQ